MLASDLSNPEFAGATNPDSMLAVEFYNHAALDTWKTGETGIKSYVPECPFIRIAIPGNDKTVIERPAHKRDTERFPRQWMVFQMQNGMADAANVPGWKITDCPEFGEEEARQLTFLRFYTVEQLAGANDAQIQGIGMGGLGLRERAKKVIAEKNAELVNKAVSERDAELNALKEQLAAQAEQMQQLMAMVQTDAPKRGRPAKEKE